MRLERKVLDFMKYKLPLIILVLLLPQVVMDNNGLKSKCDTEMPDDFQKLRIEITNVIWTIADYKLWMYENYSVFELKINFTINNTNNYIVNITFCCLREFYLVNLSASLRNGDIEIKDCNGGLAFAAVTTISIPQGISNRLTKSFIGFNNPDLTNMPDGDYIIWISLFQYEESFTTSSRTKLTIRNGLPIINYNYNPTINLSIKFTTILSSLLLIPVAIQFKKQKKSF